MIAKNKSKNLIFFYQPKVTKDLEQISTVHCTNICNIAKLKKVYRIYNSNTSPSVFICAHTYNWPALLALRFERNKRVFSNIVF